MRTISDNTTGSNTALPKSLVFPASQCVKAKSPQCGLFAFSVIGETGKLQKETVCQSTHFLHSPVLLKYKCFPYSIMSFSLPQSVLFGKPQTQPAARHSRGCGGVFRRDGWRWPLASQREEAVPRQPVPIMRPFLV